MASANTNLHKAKKAKNDEFYTQLEDISKEVSYYKNHFEGKTVLCNCDDPEWSNFWKFFHDVFNDWNLKKLISTHYNMDGSSSYALFFDGNEVTKKELVGNGDFASEECIEFLEEADIVVTNPPFSLFRKYVALLMEYEKEFLIIGNKNAITYKEIFPLIKENKMWLGYNSPTDFKQPDGSVKKQMSGLTRWFSNLDIPKRHKPLIPELKYSYEKHPEWYPKYDNYDAINVGYVGNDEKLQRQTNKVSYIPYDYKGVMGVPITFLDKYNPDEFEIVSFRKGEDGKDLFFTREREREFNRTFVSLYDVDSRDDKKCRRQNQWEAYLRKNNNQTKIEPIDYFYPLSIKSRAAGTMNGLINGKETYRRILICQKGTN